MLGKPLIAPLVHRGGSLPTPPFFGKSRKSAYASQRSANADLRLSLTFSRLYFSFAQS